MRKLGEIGDKDTENEVLLLEHDVPHSKFSEAVLSFLPQMPWKITEEVSILLPLCHCFMNPRHLKILEYYAKQTSITNNHLELLEIHTFWEGWCQYHGQWFILGISVQVFPPLSLSSNLYWLPGIHCSHEYQI